MNELSNPVSGLRKLAILGNVYYLGSADILYIEWTHLSPSCSKTERKKYQHLSISVKQELCMWTGMKVAPHSQHNPLLYYGAPSAWVH